MSTLIGTQFHRAHGDSERRQAQAMDALGKLLGVEAVDLQWEPTPPWRPWIRTVCDLHADSRGVSGCGGRRKAIPADMMRVLGGLAERGGHRYFMITNADIMVTQAAIDLIEKSGKDTYAFSRLDIDRETGRELEPTLSGLDAFAFEVRWWRANQHRFRPYIIGEACWDVVYAAIAMCHGDGLIASAGEIRHERHQTKWGQGAFADYNGYLAAVDNRYFSIWCDYYARLMEGRARGATAEEERALCKRAFVWQPSAAAALKQIGRTVKAQIGYRRKRARWNRARSEDTP
jgi:hypothetical protein